MNICLNEFFLMILYLAKTALNILRFAIPVILIIKIGIDAYKKMINPDSGDIKNIKNRLIAAFIVFLVPTVIPLLMDVLGGITKDDYNVFATCYEFADLEHINVIREDRKQEELEAYLSEQEKNLSEGKKLIAAYRKIIESNHVIAGIGPYANNKNAIKCGTGRQYDTGLFNAVRSAGPKTREGVVAAALYVSSHIDVHIPYFWSGGHFHNYDGYLDTGNNFIGISDKWGCSVKMIPEGTDKQKPNQKYPFGMDCSGFVAWSIFNGGYYTGDTKQEIIIGTDSNSKLIMGAGDDCQPQTISFSKSKGKLKPGDLLTTPGHVVMVVEVTDKKVKVAEEKGYDYGLVISEVSYGERFSTALLMDNFYKNYKKGSPIYSKFN